MPGSARGVFDERTDVIQIGLVALAALLARPLTDEEYPAQLKRLILSVKEHSKHGARPISPELRQWLERALPVDEEHAFRTVRDAQEAFEALVTKGRYAPTAAAVKAFLTRYREATASAARRGGAPSRRWCRSRQRAVREPRRSEVDRALEEFAITIGPKLPVSRSKATVSTDAVEAALPAPTTPAEPVAPGDSRRRCGRGADGHARVERRARLRRRRGRWSSRRPSKAIRRPARPEAAEDADERAVADGGASRTAQERLVVGIAAGARARR